MIKIFLLTLCLVGLAMIFFTIRILLKRGGTFHSEHIGQSRAMRERGIHCAQSTDRLEFTSKSNVTDMEK